MISRKPARWGFDRGLTAPEWRWFWESAHYALPFFGGNPPMDLVTGDILTAGGTPTIVGSAWGPAWDFDGSTDYFSIPDLTFARELATCTITLVFQTTTTNRVTPFGSVNTGTDVLIAIDLNADENSSNVSGKINLNIRDVGGPNTLNAAFSTADTSWQDGQPHVLTVVIRKGLGTSGGITMFIDGKNVPLTYFGVSTETTFNVDFDFAPTVGAYNIRGTISRHFPGQILGLYLNTDTFNAEQAQLLARDPFGPFRMFDGFTITTGAAPGGTLPIFDHHYRSMRAA